MQKYPKGTLVEIVKHEWRQDLIGKQFAVEDTQVGNLIVGKASTQRVLTNVLMYRTPFMSARPSGNNRNIWLTEEYLRPVRGDYPEDEGFEFDESKLVWTPTVIVEDGEALVV
ncbi:hypothetical protein FDJ19_gp084 [Vibrio phage Ceto]|uniref:Uncharacterized protein n=1 Tax=Vibrio phage Ceto TaxID=2570300 RepID=A0A2H5BGH4_9CAUD|nr:hypothetical protein FDJ19_gp084 [Vibrio phage Ceto]AUG85091.1 hypothetical protein CETO_84 [Vibrio phage Ceto]